MIEIVSTSTCSLLLDCFFTWASSTGTAWDLVDDHLESNFLIDVLADNAYGFLPAGVIVGFGVNSEWGEVFDTDLVDERFVAIVVHQCACGDWTLLSVLINEEFGGVHLGVLRLVHYCVWKVDLSWICNMVEEANARTGTLFLAFSIISRAVFAITTWPLCNLNLILNLSCRISAHNTYLLRPSINKVSYNINLISFIKRYEPSHKWLITITIHEFALGDRTLVLIRVDEELGS